MLERKAPLSNLKPETAKFFTDAYYDGAFEAFAEAAEAKPSLAPKFIALNMYFNLPFSTYESIGRFLRPGKPYTRSRTQQLVQEGVGLLKNFGSDDFQDKYADQKIVLRKSNLAHGINLSLARSGRTIRAAQMASEGASSEIIRDRVGSSFNAIRITARRWGVNIESLHSKVPTPEELTRRIKTVSDPDVPLEEFENMVNSLTQPQCAYLVSKDSAFSVGDLCGISKLHCRPDGFEPVRQVLLNTGIHMVTFFDTVKKGKNAGRTLRYDYVFKRELGISVAILKTEPSLNILRDNPVRQVAGVTADSSPTTTEILHSPNYVTVTPITNALGLRIGKVGYPSVAEFVDSPDCPPVFYYKKAYKLAAEDVQKFRVFANKRRRELGM